MRTTNRQKTTRKTRSRQRAKSAFGKNGASPQPKKTKRQKGLSDAELQRLTVERRKRYQPITRAMPQPMGHEAYYGRAGQVVNLITHAGTEACPESLLAQFLVGFGSIIGRGPYRYQAGLHHLNEFVVLVGESGIGCKGTSARRPVTEPSFSDRGSVRRGDRKFQPKAEIGASPLGIERNAVLIVPTNQFMALFVRSHARSSRLVTAQWRTTNHSSVKPRRWRRNEHVSLIPAHQCL